MSYGMYSAKPSSGKVFNAVEIFRRVSRMSYYYSMVFHKLGHGVFVGFRWDVLKGDIGVGYWGSLAFTKARLEQY